VGVAVAAAAAVVVVDAGSTVQSVQRGLSDHRRSTATYPHDSSRRLGGAAAVGRQSSRRRRQDEHRRFGSDGVAKTATGRVMRLEPTDMTLPIAPGLFLS